MLSIGKLLRTFRLPCEKWFRTEENMTFSMRYTNGKQRKPLGFPAFTHINLPGKCVFSAANSGEYVVVNSENANEQKENKLFVVR